MAAVKGAHCVKKQHARQSYLHVPEGKRGLLILPMHFFYGLLHSPTRVAINKFFQEGKIGSFPPHCWHRHFEF